MLKNPTKIEVLTNKKKLDDFGQLLFLAKGKKLLESVSGLIFAR